MALRMGLSYNLLITMKEIKLLKQLRQVLFLLHHCLKVALSQQASSGLKEPSILVLVLMALPQRPMSRLKLMVV
jgi:hypothetical protein